MQKKKKKKITWEARRTASLSRYRVKWLVKLKLPVSHFPAGTYSIEPPSDWNWLRWSTAVRKASVFNVLPSPTPPKSVNDAVCALQLMAGYSTVSHLCTLCRPWTLPNAARITTASSKTRRIAYQKKLIQLKCETQSEKLISK